LLALYRKKTSGAASDRFIFGSAFVSS